MDKLYLSSNELWNIENCDQEWIKQKMFDLDDSDYELMMTGLEYEKIDRYCKTHQSIYELKNKVKNNSEWKNINNLPWEITYTVNQWDTLWKIIKNIYWLNNWSEISQKLSNIYYLNPWLTENIKPWDEIKLAIEDTQWYIDRTYKKWNIAWVNHKKEDSKIIVTPQDWEENNIIHKPKIITAQFVEKINELGYDKFSWELNIEAFEIFKNMKNTRWKQIIWTYRDKNWELKNIVLKDIKWKNIYMELDKSYKWNDIDSWNIDSIQSKEELEKVLKKLLETYEIQNREDY